MSICSPGELDNIRALDGRLEKAGLRYFERRRLEREYTRTFESGGAGYAAPAPSSYTWAEGAPLSQPGQRGAVVELADLLVEAKLSRYWELLVDGGGLALMVRLSLIHI